MLSHIGSLCLRIPWQYVLIIIQHILQYYLFIFPYRPRPLTIEASLNQNELNENSFSLHPSISTSLLNSIVTRNFQLVSKQTNSPSSADVSNINRVTNGEIHLYNPVKRYKLSFNQPLLPLSSFKKFLHQSPTVLLYSYIDSRKSLISLSQHISMASLSHPLQQQYLHDQHSCCIFRPNDLEINRILADNRPSSSLSSSALLRTVHYDGNHTSLHHHKSLECQESSTSTYFLGYSNPPDLRQRPHLTSTTNITPSDSSHTIKQFNQRHFSTVTHQRSSQFRHIRDKNIVTANERKALRVLLIIFGVFITLWTPFFICTFISAICEQCREHIPSTAWFSVTWLGYSSSMANPFIYTIFSDVFRRAFLDIIFCRPNDSLSSRQCSTRSLHQKGTSTHTSLHQKSTPKPYRNQKYSITSTPHHLRSFSGNDTIVYINRHISNSFQQMN